jgi:hypothetical protein
MRHHAPAVMKATGPAIDPAPVTATWRFVTNHAAVLIEVALDAKLRHRRLSGISIGRLLELVDAPQPSDP